MFPTFILGFIFIVLFFLFNTCTKKFVVDSYELVGWYMLIQKRSFGSKEKITPCSGSDLGVQKTLNIVTFLYKTLFPCGAAAHSGLWPFFEDSRSNTSTNHIRWYSSGRVIRSSQRLPDNTENSQGTNTHTLPAGFEPAASERPRTHSLDRAATWIGIWNMV